MQYERYERELGFVSGGRRTCLREHALDVDSCALQVGMCHWRAIVRGCHSRAWAFTAARRGRWRPVAPNVASPQVPSQVLSEPQPPSHEVYGPGGVTDARTGVAGGGLSPDQ